MPFMHTKTYVFDPQAVALRYEQFLNSATRLISYTTTRLIHGIDPTDKSSRPRPRCVDHTQSAQRCHRLGNRPTDQAAAYDDVPHPRNTHPRGICIPRSG